jgi:hypothetical protein
MAEVTREKELLTPHARWVIFTCSQRAERNLKTTQNSEQSLHSIINAKFFNNVLLCI